MLCAANCAAAQSLDKTRGTRVTRVLWVPHWQIIGRFQTAVSECCKELTAPPSDASGRAARTSVPVLLQMQMVLKV